MARAVKKPARHAAPVRPERKPLPPPRGPSSSFEEAIASFHLALGKACSFDDLVPYQQDVLYGLLGGPSEHAVAHLYDWWEYDLDALRKRGGGHKPAKPRIILTLELTRRNNLSIEWHPDGGQEIDWVFWHRTPAYAGYRPTNEILLMHTFGYLNVRPSEYQSPFIRSIDEHLLAMTAALIRDFARRLAHSFQVRFVTELDLEWEPEPKDAWPLTGQHVLNWSIVDVEERAYRAERAELEEQLREIGHDGKSFVKLLLDAVPGLLLDDFQRETVRRKVRTALMARGVVLTPTPLARLVAMLDRHQPLVLAPLRRPTE